jgi:hypothetical protein
MAQPHSNICSREMTVAPRVRATDEDLDSLLSAQILVAWAGETGRLGWWRTNLVSRWGGLDFFASLTPGSARWAVLQAVREAARRHDAERRGQSGAPDAKLTLFHLGFEIDELADERLRHHKRTGADPLVVFPGICDFIRLPQLEDLDGDGEERFEVEAFERFLRVEPVKYVFEPGARRLVGTPPEVLRELVRQLLGALTPLAKGRGPGEPQGSYPLPYYLRRRA